jgi:hypothetical protein
MKNFTTKEKNRFVNNFLLVHGHASSMSNTTAGRIFFSNAERKPFSLVMLHKSFVTTCLPLEDLAEIPYDFMNMGNIEPYYLVPNFIHEAKYTGSPGQKQALYKWIEKSKEFATNYLAKPRCEDYLDIQVKIFRQLSNLAIGLWNMITFESEEYNNFDNCLNPVFWKAFNSAKFYDRVNYTDPTFNCSYEEFEETIINSFETIEDIIQFEEYILNYPIRYNIWGGSNTLVQEDIRLKVLKKLIAKNSLEKPTPMLQVEIDYIENNLERMAVADLIKKLKTIEFCSYNCLKELYQKILIHNKSKTVTNYIEKIMTKNK